MNVILVFFLFKHTNRVHYLVKFLIQKPLFININPANNLITKHNETIKNTISNDKSVNFTNIYCIDN